MTERAEVKAILQEVRCGFPPASASVIETLSSYISQLEWKLKQERAKVRQLQQRLDDIEALEGGKLDDEHNRTNEQPEKTANQDGLTEG